MAKRISVGKRLADDMQPKRGFDALFSDTPVHQSTVAAPKSKRFEKGTFYFDPDDLAHLDRVWLQLMGQGVKCNKSEIVSVLVSAGLEEHERSGANSLLLKRLTGKRRRG
jgi:hypothetical protein